MTDLLPVRSDLCHGPQCNEMITEMSPSRDFHSEGCQQRWNERWTGKHVDPDVEPTTGIGYEDLFNSFYGGIIPEGIEAWYDTTPIRMPETADPVRKLASIHTAPFAQWWAWLRGKR
jgi:hypothetical protein